MLPWILLFAGLALMAVSMWLVVAMLRAERRARRGLYRGLGLAESTVDFLMERNRDVLTELTYVRQNEGAAIETIQQVPLRQAAGGGGRPKLRLVEPPSEANLLAGERPGSPDEHPTRH